MLKFDSLELIGFKSFAEKTRIVFNDRTTAIIGPNGCGKSNLADAIGWVLGVQNARNLRGQIMDDVIFSGTGKRKPSGFAQVTVTLRRTGEAPIRIGQEEIDGNTLEIGRKLYRDGESIYLLNQRRCRLKDIHDFMDEAGLGFSSYAMIAQGRIESFLSAKPLDRRAIIEEAARITGYKSKRRSAELKLEMAQQNLLRLNDIILEVERQLRSLKRQAGRAKRYREIREEYRQAQRQKFVLEAQFLKASLATLQTDLDHLRTAQEELKQELGACEQAYRESTRKRDQLETSLNDLRQRRSEIHLEIDRTENSIRYNHDQVENTRRQLEGYTEEQKALSHALQKNAEELTRCQAERTNLQAEEKKVEEARTGHSELLERCRPEVQKSESYLEELRANLLRLSAEMASLNNQGEQLGQRLADSFALEDRIQKELADYSARLQETAGRLGQLKSVLACKRTDLAKLKADLEKQERVKGGLEAELKDAQAALAESQNQLIAQRERLQSLQEVELSHSQYSEGVQKLLNHLSQNQSVRAGGTLADFIETSPEYERLVEEFLDEELEYVLVDSLDEALRGIAEVKSLKGARCTFLTLNSSNGFDKPSGHRADVRPSQDEGIHGTLADILRMKPEVQAAFHRVLPQSAGAIIVSDLDRAVLAAHNYPESIFITLEGETLTPRGLLSASAGQLKKLGLLGLKRQKRELEKKITHFQKAFAGLQEKEKEISGKLESVVQARLHDQELYHTLDREIISLGHQQEQLDAEHQRESRAVELLEQELTQLEAERQRQGEQIQALEKQLKEKTEAQVQTEKMLAQEQSSLQEFRMEFSRIQEQIHVISSDRKVIQERCHALDRAFNGIQEQRSGLESRQQSNQLARAEAEERLSAIKQMLGQLEADLSRHRKDLESADAKLNQVHEEYEKWKSLHPEIEERLAGLRDRKMERQEQRSGLDIERVRTETQLHSLEQQCLEQLQFSLQEAASGFEFEDQDLEQANQTCSDLKSRLDEFGPINMTALEEYQENEERYEFLSRQKQDIEQSISDTTRAIHEINRRSREKFKEAFEAINGYFQTVFQKLFGGGECGMQLLDEEDLLESGIDVYAQPPGKKLQNVMLLSGGEKAMTVLSLLVALFHYRPSQFCVLDEVDAPLDEANVKRFTELTGEMSRQIQLILITHNKKTMEAADALFGVTMEEPGVSQVVSVKFD
ncbi:MAG: chromosome segregation protein SMC [Acidobacteriota bacterium]